MVTLTLSLLAAPLTAEAPRRNIPLVGVLEPAPTGPTGLGRCFASFQHGLRDLGHVEGQTMAFAHRYAEGQPDRLPALAAELVRLTPDVIWTHSNDAALAAKQATTTIPVVVGVSQDLVKLGVVASLAQPGGNLTGLDLGVFEGTGKRLELLKEAVPTVSRVAVLVTPTDPLSKAVPHNIEREAQALGVQLQRIEARGPETFEAAFAAMVQGRADAVLLPEGPPLGPYMPRLLELAHQHRLPTMCSARHYAQAGCLLAYGAYADELCQRSAVFVDKLLKGAKPADLPVERGYKLYLDVNLKTAEALGLTLSPLFLSRADEVLR
jgi:putative ABC transport system substrate-binding protein